MSSLHYADKKYYISSSTYNQIKSLWQWLINFNITFNIENFQQVPFVSQTWVQHMALWQAIVHLRIHAKILVQESRSHWFLNRNRIAPFPCRSTYQGYSSLALLTFDQLKGRWLEACWDKVHIGMDYVWQKWPDGDSRPHVSPHTPISLLSTDLQRCPRVPWQIMSCVLFTVTRK